MDDLNPGCCVPWIEDEDEQKRREMMMFLLLFAMMDKNRFEQVADNNYRWKDKEDEGKDN